MKKRLSLKTQIIGLLLIVVIVPSAIVAIKNGFDLKNNFKQMYDATTTDNVNRVSESVSDTYKTYSEAVSLLSLNSSVKNMKNDDAASEALLLKDLQNFIDTHKDASSVYLGLSNGNMLMYPSGNLSKDFDPRQRPWYKGAVDSGEKVFLTSPYEDATEKGSMIVSFAKAVRDENTKEVIGVIGIDIKLKTLSGLVSQIKVGNEGHIALLDRDGQIIAHKDPKLLGKTAKDQAWIKDIVNSSSNIANEKIGNTNFAVTKQINKDTGWLITGFTSQDEISRKVRNSIFISVLITIICLIAAISLGIVYVRRIIKSINNITGALDKFKNGDFTQKVEKDANASLEVDTMEDAVNVVVDNTATAITSIIESTKQVKEAAENLSAVTEESNAVGEEIAKAVQEIAAGATQQANDVQEGSNITASLGEEINKSMEASEDMLKTSNKVKKSTDDGFVVVNGLKEIFGQSSSANEALAKEVQILAENSNKIGAITDTIKSITEQTNLLALNASIEAARAGEAGKGFAVVAEEVRKLAEESSGAASEINDVVLEMKESVNGVSEKIKLTTELNKKTNQSVDSTNISFKNIQEASETLENNVQKVTKALEKINKGKDSVNKQMSTVSDVAHGTAATSQEVSASSEEQAAGLQEIASSAQKLTDLAEQLSNIISIFKI